MKNQSVLAVRSTTALLICLMAHSPAWAQKVEPKVKIGPDTTVIDGPLTADGYIDYVGHLNEVLKKGVTPENNSAVLFLKAYPGEITTKKFMKKYCEALGIAPVPLKKDNHFLDYYRFAIEDAKAKKGAKLNPEEQSRAQKAIDKDYEKATEGPWKRKDIPSMAKWMDSVEEPMKLITKGAKRSRYYHPLINLEEDGSGHMITVLLPQAQSSRGFARALVVRAMMYLGEGEIDKCLDDILTMRRLGNHVASGATIVEQLVGIAIIGIAQDAERKVAFSGKLSADELLDYRAQMAKHRIRSNMAKSFSNCERFMYLDAVQQVMKRGMKGLNEIVGMAGGMDSGGRPQTKMQEMLDKVITSSTDWSLTMKEGNKIYDRYESELKDASWEAQDKALQSMEAEVQKISQEVSGSSAMFKAVLGGPEYRGKMMGKIFVSMLLPALNAASGAEKRSKVMDDLSYVVLSIAAHKAENGEYPRSLQDLKGDAGKDIPVDKYADADYRYRRNGEGFLVYSIGPNRKDDNGNGVYNEKMNEGDDYGAGYESSSSVAESNASQGDIR